MPDDRLDQLRRELRLMYQHLDRKWRLNPNTKITPEILTRPATGVEAPDRERPQGYAPYGSSYSLKQRILRFIRKLFGLAN